jgi:hypothetical protein
MQAYKNSAYFLGHEYFSAEYKSHIIQSQLYLPIVY